MSDETVENTIEEELRELPKELERYIDMPYGGLFGNNIQIKIIEEIVADPYRSYQPKDFEEMTGATSIKKAFNNIIKLGLIKKEKTEDGEVVYKPNLGSKIITALTLLSYALIDDRDGTNIMDKTIEDYFLKVLKPKIKYKVK